MSKFSRSNVTLQTIQAFFLHDGFGWAAKIAFYGLFAIIPLTMIMTSIVGFFLGSSDELMAQVAHNILLLFPILHDDLVHNLSSLMEQKSSLGSIGVIFLIFVASILVVTISQAFDVIFQTKRKRHFLHSYLVGASLLFIFSIVFFLPAMVQILEGLLHRYGFIFPFGEIWNTKLFFGFSMFLGFVATVKFVPIEKVLLRHAAIGGIIFALGLLIAKHLFRWYMLVALTRYNIIYGSFTAMILLLLWIYYVAVVLILASESVAILKRRLEEKG
ncbi:MAG: YihY/virulence factor BrkB family protein [Deltaproteobacteria bacterium]|nr:YihY/virulence factor BrkB family protein [Deltaproteobacteria bacterium]